MLTRYVCLLLLAVLPPLAFYGWFESNARATVRRDSLGPGFANALKHAEASSYMHSGLRFVGIPAPLAEEIVVQAGVLSERAEFYIHGGTADTTAEIMKDLHNNMVGISVSKWLETTPGHPRTELFIQLGKCDLLLLSADKVELSAQEKIAVSKRTDLGYAITWYAQSQLSIDNVVSRWLDDMAAAHLLSVENAGCPREEEKDEF